jgi:hypothetical protein
VIQDKNGVAWTTAAQYVKGLDRYFVATGNTRNFESRITVLESKKPWGPWRTVAYGKMPGPEKQGFHLGFLANSFSKNGRKFTLTYTGIGKDSLILVDGKFVKAQGKAAAKAGKKGAKGKAEAKAGKKGAKAKATSRNGHDRKSAGKSGKSDRAGKSGKGDRGGKSAKGDRAR